MSAEAPIPAGPEGIAVVWDRMQDAEWKLRQIREAHTAYEWALKRREHGAVAADRFIRAVVEVLGVSDGG